MTARAVTPPSPAIRSGLVCLILIGGAGLLYLLGCRFLSEYHQYRADILIEKRYFGLAANHLRAAAAFQPNDSRIHQALGELHFELAGMADSRPRALASLARAREHFLTAARKNPLNAEVHYRLGKTLAWLEAENRPEGAAPPESGPNLAARFHFQEAVRLRPHGLLYNFGLLHDLARHNETEAMLPVVRTLVAGHPPILGELKRKTFWSPAIESAGIEGLHQAIEKNLFPRQAYLLLSEWMAERGAWAESITLYRNALGIGPDPNTAGHYLHLGKLYIRAGAPQKAAEQFAHGLSMSPRPDTTLARIHGIYKTEAALENFDGFFTDHRDRFFFSHRADILYARHLMDTGRYEQARHLLEAVNLDTPRAEAYYWLARIAQAEQNWDRMELAIQKATLHDPRNAHYHQVFAEVLRRMKKTERAEREAALAKEYR